MIENNADRYGNQTLHHLDTICMLEIHLHMFVQPKDHNQEDIIQPISKEQKLVQMLVSKACLSVMWWVDWLVNVWVDGLVDLLVAVLVVR